MMLTYGKHLGRSQQQGYLSDVYLVVPNSTMLCGGLVGFHLHLSAGLLPRASGVAADNPLRVETDAYFSLGIP